MPTEAQNPQRGDGGHRPGRASPNSTACPTPEDDLVRSGATIKAMADQLTAAGAKAVYVLAATQTRRR
jgi:hypothetical protein